MKKVNYIGLLLVTLLFASCDLDKYPYSEVAADEYVKNASSVNNLVLGCYNSLHDVMYYCLLYTSDAADEEDSVDLGGRRTIKKKKIYKQKKKKKT